MASDIFSPFSWRNALAELAENLLPDRPLATIEVTGRVEDGMSRQRDFADCQCEWEERRKELHKSSVEAFLRQFR